MRIYPVIETMYEDQMCRMAIAPARVDAAVAERAQQLAHRTLKAFEGAGVFTIEMFLHNDELLVNEIAPRVHNAGHLTIEACETSQFEQHIRAITHMPLGETAMKVPAAVMINIIGERTGPAEPIGIEEAEKLGGVYVHIYGKLETRPERKMGHVTATGASVDEALVLAEKARSLIRI